MTGVRVLRRSAATQTCPPKAGHALVAVLRRRLLWHEPEALHIQPDPIFTDRAPVLIDHTGPTKHLEDHDSRSGR